MKITAVRAHPISVPLETPKWVGGATFFAAAMIVVEVDTDDGITGLATVHGSGMKATCAILAELQDLLRGRDPLAHEAIWRDIFALTTDPQTPEQRKANNNLFSDQNRAPMVLALAAIDIALWDIKGKAANMPVWRLLGAGRTSIPVYVTGGYYETGQDHVAAVVEEMVGYVDQGFTQLKIKVGGIALDEDVRRIAAVRQAVGPSTLLMLDANGSYSLGQAVEAINRYAEFGITWFEEPLHWYDTIRALGTLAQRVTVPIASGESELTGRAARDLVDLGGVRYMQFDATRAGGVTEWLRVAGYCHLHDVTMTTHHAAHIQGHLCAAASNGWNAECFPNPDRDPIWPALYEYRAEIKDGHLHLNNQPGFGFAVDWRFVDRHRI